MSLIEITKNTRTNHKARFSKQGHNCYEIYLFLDGDGILYIEKTSYKINKGSVAIIKPNMRHLVFGGNFVKYSLYVFPEILTKFEQSVLDMFSRSPVFNLSVKALPYVSNVFKIMHNTNRTEKFREDIMHILFADIILEFYKHANSNEPDVDKKDYPPMIYNIITFVEQNYAKKLTLETIAQDLNYSVPNIRKNFKKYVGVSISKYVLNLRLDKVKDLLATTNKNMNEIAEECGFSSANYLSLIFKEKESLSPLAYRKIKS